MVAEPGVDLDNGAWPRHQAEELEEPGGGERDRRAEHHQHPQRVGAQPGDTHDFVRGVVRGVLVNLVRVHGTSSLAVRAWPDAGSMPAGGVAGIREITGLPGTPRCRGAAGAQRMAPACASSGASRASSAREATPSLGKTLYRWYSTVRGLTNSCAAISRLVAPAAASRAICSSKRVSWVSVEGSRRRAVWPVAR